MHLRDIRQASLSLFLTKSPGPLIETIVCVCPSRLEAQVVCLVFRPIVFLVVLSLEDFLDMDD